MIIFEYLTDDGTWSAEHCGTQDTSNAPESLKEAISELPRLARVMDCELARLRIRERKDK